jgi:spore maturation protein CgeB
LPDRESRVNEFFLKAATLAPEKSFILGGEGWSTKTLPANVRWIGHVPSTQHNVINCSAKMVLNVNRDSMAKIGSSPPTRIFEAAGAGMCVITDYWQGIEDFFAPEAEILTARSGAEVATLVKRMTEIETAKIGFTMLNRALREHTYEARARQVHEAFYALFSQEASSASKAEKELAIPLLTRRAA